MDTQAKNNNLVSSFLRKSDKRFLIVAGVLIIAILVIIIFLKPFAQRSDSKSDNSQNTINSTPTLQSLSFAEIAGKRLSNNNCTGNGPVKLTVSPMKPEDFST